MTILYGDSYTDAETDPRQSAEVRINSRILSGVKECYHANFLTGLWTRLVSHHSEGLRLYKVTREQFTSDNDRSS
jgi:hypothetical protein